jgi:hypothetical protein
LRISNWVVPSRRLTSPARAGTAAPTDVARAHRRHQRPRSPPFGAPIRARVLRDSRTRVDGGEAGFRVAPRPLASLPPAPGYAVPRGPDQRQRVGRVPRPLHGVRDRAPARVEALNRRRVDPAEVHPALRHARTETEQTRRAGSVQSAGGRGLPRRMDVNAARKCQARCGLRRRP